MRLSKSKAIALAALVVLSLLVGAAGNVAAANTTAENSAMNYSADKAPHKYIYEDKVGIAVHDRSEMDSPLQYYDDNGDLATLPASLNDSINNSLSWRMDQIEDADLNVYPRKGEDNNSAAITDASEWTSESNVSVTQTDDTTASGVQSITIDTDGSLGSSSVTNATYSNQSITSDPGKRVFAGAVNVNSMESGVQVIVAVVDSDGDTKEMYINASMDASADNVIANQTGNGYFFQQKLHTLATKGNGDGTFDGIETTRITVEGGDADVTTTTIDVQRKSAIVLGERMADTDSDDELETVTVEEITSPGRQTYRSLDSMGSVFNDAKIHNLQVHGLMYQIRDVPSEDVEVNFDTGAADSYGSYPNDFEQYGRLMVPAQIDLTHYGLELRAEQKFVSERYVKFRYSEGAGTTAFGDISSWTDASGSLSGEGDTIVLDSSIQAGTNYVVHQVTLLQKGQAADLKPSTSPSGGGGAQTDGGVSIPIIGGIFAVLLGVVKKLGL